MSVSLAEKIVLIAHNLPQIAQIVSIQISVILSN